ncbi:radical SAM protein [Plesiomonas shigelloides]|uniref:radical SAM protein n=1 Tax=Plesiomonas shigelloides TaxID=703 RepID=UPI00288450AA|nr:radical SAM protein [Plesiomonas shigelloides]MDT1012016.1 radical SAM protein [Plesiomonas shigelloides]
MHPLKKLQQQHAICEIESIQRQQNDGTYPSHFSYPVGLQFELTSKCNLTCKHCYNSSGSNHYTDLMHPSDWNELAKQIVSDGGLFQAIISGGEPLLLGAELFSFMDVLSDDGTAFILITNGMLVRESTVKKLKKYKFFWVQVSIDDLLEENHDEFRGAIGSWKKASDAAFMLSSAGLPVRIAHSVTKDNIERLDKMIDFAYELGASSIVCGAIMPSGRAAENEGLVPDDEIFTNKIYDIVELKQKQYAGKMTILNSADHTTDIAKKKMLPNSAAIIRPNGDVRIDCTMPFVVGNVKNNTVKEIWLANGSHCWNHPDVTQYISALDQYGNHPTHKNHIDPDMVILKQ